MNTSIGDLAQSFVLQRRGASLKTSMNRLSLELSTGRVADTKSVLAGNISYFSDIERDIKALEGYKVAAAEAGQFHGAMQVILGRVQENSGDLANSMLLIGSAGSYQAVPQVIGDARINLESLVSSINSDFAGRSLFSGAATNTAPLASADTIVAGLTAVVAGQPDAASIIAAAQTWFDDPAGFRATAYLGSDTPMSPYVLSDVDRLQLDVRADDPVFRDLIMNTALGAIIDDGALGFSEAIQSEVVASAGGNLLAAQDSVTRLRADVGFTEARIETVTARNAAEAVSLEFARNELLAADPYETASKLEEVQFQLQSLYTVTVRLSELSLLNFIR